MLWGDVSDKCRFGLDCPVLSFAEVMARGRGGVTPVELRPSDLATLVYTSGTTGKPKVGTGVSCVSLRMHAHWV